MYHRQDFFEGGSRFRWHEHPFWQIDFCLSGAIEVRVGERATVLDPGDCFVIGPRQRHCFAYLEPRNDYLSIKYELRESDRTPRLGCIRGDDTLKRFLRLLQALVPKGEHAPTADAKPLARVLEGLLSHLSAESDAVGGRDVGYGELVSRVLRIIDQGKGRLRQVGELARELGVTQGHLRARFKRETGASLKEKVDAVCMERARLLLAYSDRSVSELAEELGFPDLFAFSRYFKQRQGCSPRAYRHKLER
ncbi:AraC family transcriptional regulator [Pelagicoccus enzymogenes]|uniref:helix-turn-helix transcriptional regulator n=1 Tax=Pelagicoccus enzymogenes TaxID=2773457 RepID=UPI00280CB9AD|nr:AraC family transcriptional regulator [Pelagicoccus enzymogenes]MDQ8200139.1 AraC family transcriptional regulator [Pelagicoccus enzymogenes]